MQQSTPRSVEEYLATVPEHARVALERLREAIRETVPDATESISYRIPTLSYRGPLVAFSAHKNHYSLHVMSSTLLDGYGDDLVRYERTKGSVHFEYDEPLPTALVARLVRARVEENEARAKGRGS